MPVDRARDEVGDLARSLAAMQERLRQQEEARRAFVATASHELRTPLTSLDGMLELLDDDLEYHDPDIADARDLVARARAQSRRLGRLAADLLDLSRMDAQVDLRSSRSSSAEISRAVLAEFELGADERGIRMSLELRGESAWALGDPGSIARILRILVDNAIRISPRGSEIRVRLRRGKVVTLSVCDEGPGVREEERDAIFQRFKRGRDTGGQAGFGLGLAIGRELARRMDGDLVRRAGGGDRGHLHADAAGRPRDRPRSGRAAGRDRGALAAGDGRDAARVWPAHQPRSADSMLAVDKDLMQATLEVDERHWWYRGRRKVIRAELDALPLARRCQVLDAGCGSGARCRSSRTTGRCGGSSSTRTRPSWRARAVTGR